MGGGRGEQEGGGRLPSAVPAPDHDLGHRVSTGILEFQVGGSMTDRSSIPRARASRPHAATLAFLGFATLVYAVSLAIAGRLPGLAHPDAVAVGMTLDMVVVVPLAFHFLIVRRRRMPVLALAPIVIAGCLAAALVLPRDRHGLLRLLETAIAPAELGLVGWIVWRAVRSLRRSRAAHDADPLERLHEVAHEALGLERVAAMIASEVAVFHYAFFAWRARPHAPRGATAFTHHRRSGHAGTVVAIILLLAVEGFAMHFLITRWSAIAAWIFTASSVYAALWLIADHRATVLRPILVDDQGLWARAGLRASVRVPWSSIAAVSLQAPEVGRAAVRLTMFGSPSHWILLTEPVLVRGPYGFTRRALALGFEPDEPEAFARLVAACPSNGGRP